MSFQKRKVVIIGAGHVGSHVGFALISQGLCEEIVYIDTNREKAEAQALDLFDATNYMPTRTYVHAGDYSDARDADLIVVSVGPLPDISKGETRMDTLRETMPMLKDVVKGIRSSGFSGIIVDITNPADVVTHYLQHELDWPARRILSTSTTLDSARLRRAISQATGVNQKSITAYCLGEHGESQFAAWSQASIGGKPLSELRERYPDTYGKLNLPELEQAARRGGWIVLGGKGSTEFGIGASAAEVIRAIFHDESRVLPVSVLLDGEYGEKDVYASVPAVLDKDGVREILELNLTKEEQEKLYASCRTLYENYKLALTL